MRRLLLLLIILFFNLIFETYAFEAKINTSSNEIGINDSFSLSIEIGFEGREEFEVRNIEGIKENFDIISSSQAQSSSTNVSIVNGKAETISKSVKLITFILAPKSKGTFLLGPFSIVSSKETKETNSLEVSVLEDEFVGKVDENLGGINKNTGDKSNEKGLLNKYIYISIFLFILFALYVIFDKRYNKMEDLEKNDFEEETSYVYPSVSDIDFIQKLEQIFNSKIEKKSKINGEEENDEIKNIFQEFQKAKYSNILIDKKKLLEMVERI